MAMRLGVIGGGQLARMMIAPAVELGIDIRVLAEAPGMSAALAATATGDYRDLETVHAFAREVDVVTFDHGFGPLDIDCVVFSGDWPCCSCSTITASTYNAGSSYQSALQYPST